MDPNEFRRMLEDVCLNLKPKFSGDLFYESLTGIFMIRDQLFLFFANCEFNKYPSCSVTKWKSVSFIEKLELIIDIRDFITYFFS